MVYANTIVTFDSVKQSALLYKYVIPIRDVWERTLHVVNQAEIVGVAPVDLSNNSKNLFSDFCVSEDADYQVLKSDFLPPHLAAEPSFAEALDSENDGLKASILKFIDARSALEEALIEDGMSAEDVNRLLDKFARIGFGQSRQRASGQKPKPPNALLNRYGLRDLPIDVDSAMICESQSNEVGLSVAIPLMRVIDVKNLSWKHIIDFRRDEDSQKLLRSFRIFFQQNWSGKSNAFIEDDICKKLDDYDRIIRKWGFETFDGAFTMLVSSKVLVGSLIGSLVSALSGLPPQAILAEVGGAGALEIGRLAIYLTRRKFDLADIVADSPVSYVSRIREKSQN